MTKDVRNKTISHLDLVRHTLLDTLEFSALCTSPILGGTYELTGIGHGFGVGLNEESAFQTMQNSKTQEAIFIHTHPLANDDIIIEAAAGIDARKNIAAGSLPLPLGNPPTWGDIHYFIPLKERAERLGIHVRGAVFAASGIWIFDVDMNHPFISAFRRVSADNLGKFWKYVDKQNELPDYFMETEVPSLRKMDGQSPSKKDIKRARPAEPMDKSTENREFLNKTLDDAWDYILGNFSQQPTRSKTLPANNVIIDRVREACKVYGVRLDFEFYLASDIDPIKVLKSGIEEWERRLGGAQQRR